MNHLSHYHFAQSLLDNGLYCLGLIYPDIEPEWRTTEGIPAEIVRGAEEHAIIDDAFHNLGWFVAAKDSLKEDSKPYNVEVLVHRALEIGIDLQLHPRIAGTGLIERVKLLLSADEVTGFLGVFRKGRETVMAISQGGRLESYGTFEGGVEALQRSHVDLFGYAYRTTAITELYQRATDAANGFFGATQEELLGKIKGTSEQ